MGPIETWNSGSKLTVLLSKTTDELWDPYRFVSLVLKSLFCMHKTTDEGWTHSHSGANHAILHAQIDR